MLGARSWWDSVCSQGDAGASRSPSLDGRSEAGEAGRTDICAMSSLRRLCRDQLALTQVGVVGKMHVGPAGRAGESRQDLAPDSGVGDELEVHRSESYSRIWHVAK